MTDPTSTKHEWRQVQEVAADGDTLLNRGVTCRRCGAVLDAVNEDGDCEKEWEQ